LNSKTAGLQNSSTNSRNKQAHQLISNPGGNGWQTGQKRSVHNFSNPSYNQSVDTQSVNSFKNDFQFINSIPSESTDDTYENMDNRIKQALEKTAKPVASGGQKVPKKHRQ
jgi:hypothetical protein